MKKEIALCVLSLPWAFSATIIGGHTAAAQEPVLCPGDADQDLDFDAFDLVQVLQVGKYLTGERATWGEGDWNADGVLDQLDVIATLPTGRYLQGPAKMGLYSNVIFPRFYDCLMDKPFWEKYRQAQLASVHGEILEIGVGTGLNLPHYPKHVRRIVTVDPNPGMNKKLRRRIGQTGIEVDQRIIGSEQLPFDDGTFDCVVSTVTLCSISAVKQAMAELFRVLKPGGRILFLEHGASPDARVARWQRRLNGFQRLIGNGCTLTLDVPALFSTQPFRSLDFDTFYMEDTPKTHGFMYRGMATK